MANKTHLLSEKSKKSAIWLTIISIMALPIAYLRNVLLCRIDPTGITAGNYAIIVLFFQVATTFFLFGGSNVVTNFIPKINGSFKKSAFIFSYATLSLILTSIFICLVNIYPSILEFTLQKDLNADLIIIFSVIVPTMVFSQLVLYSYNGFMKFKEASLIGRTQLFLVTLATGVAFFGHQNYFTKNSLIILAIIVVLANLFIISKAIKPIYKFRKHVKLKIFFPVYFWRFSLFTHLNSILTFAYNSVDKIIVLMAIGKKELGAYFMIYQCAELVRFIPLQLAQVLLLAFSNLIKQKQFSDLKDIYQKSANMILVISTPIALFFLIFSNQFLSFFGEWIAEKHWYLVWLAIIVHMMSLGNINRMLIMASHQVGLLFTTNIIAVATQLILTIFYIKEYGVYAIIASRAISVIFAQNALLLIIKFKLPEYKIKIPKLYYTSILLVLACISCVLLLDNINLLWSIILYLGFIIIFALIARFIFKVSLPFKRRN